MDRTHLAYSASVATREVSRGKNHVSLRRLQAYVTSIEPYSRRGSGRREGLPVFKAHVPQDRDPKAMIGWRCGPPIIVNDANGVKLSICMPKRHRVHSARPIPGIL
jgi:hypothetical protein